MGAAAPLVGAKVIGADRPAGFLGDKHLVAGAERALVLGRWPAVVFAADR